MPPTRSPLFTGGGSFYWTQGDNMPLTTSVETETFCQVMLFFFSRKVQLWFFRWIRDLGSGGRHVEVTHNLNFMQMSR